MLLIKYRYRFIGGAISMFKGDYADGMRDDWIGVLSIMHFINGHSKTQHTAGMVITQGADEVPVVRYILHQFQAVTDSVEPMADYLVAHVEDTLHKYERS